MGYELRMHVGESPYTDRQNYLIKEHGGKFPIGFGEKVGTKKNPAYFIETSKVDLCKVCGKVASAFFKLRNKGEYCYIYESDDDTQCTEDRYGDRLRLLPADKVLQILKENNGGPFKYRRYTMAIALLEVVVKEFDNPVVTLYGH